MKSLSGRDGRQVLARVPGLVAAIGWLALGCGCAVDVGSGPAKHPTVGEELIDLKRARDAGAISESEYESKKEELMGRRP